MTEREKTNWLREKELKRIKEFYEKEGFIVERILSQNSPSSLILFSEDQENIERYIEIKFIVKKPEYEPDNDMEDFKVEVHNRAVKKVRAELNRLGKEERLVEESKSKEKVRAIEEKFGVRV